jgi:hypothetical protein
MYIETSSLYRRPLCSIKIEKSQSFLLLATLVGFSGSPPRGTTNIQTTSDLCTRVLKLFVGYRNHRVPYTGLQQLKVLVFDLIDGVLHIPFRNKKSSGVKFCDLAG